MSFFPGEKLTASLSSIQLQGCILPDGLSFLGFFASLIIICKLGIHIIPHFTKRAYITSMKPVEQKREASIARTHPKIGSWSSPLIQPAFWGCISRRLFSDTMYTPHISKLFGHSISMQCRDSSPIFPATESRETHQLFIDYSLLTGLVSSVSISNFVFQITKTEPPKWPWLQQIGLSQFQLKLAQHILCLVR